MIKTNKLRIVSYANLELPPTVYKYRVWKDEFHDTILRKQQVFFAQPTTFPDKLDCKIPIRYDLLTSRQIFELYLFHSHQDHPTWSRQQHRSFARDWAKKSPLRDKQRVKEQMEKEFVEFDKRFGVLSLTADPSNMSMWEAYAANHSGFCVGFDPLRTFQYFGGGSIVEYMEQLPVILPRPFHDFHEQHYLQVFSKLKKWEFEKEYRVHTFRTDPLTMEDRQKDLPAESYTEVILGAKIADEDKAEIIDVVKAKLPHVKILQAKIDNGMVSFELIK